MTLSVTTNQTAAIGAAAVRTIYFVEFHFANGTQYMSNSNQNITWGGHTWLGVGTLGTISEISESDSLTTSSLTFTINAMQPSWLALAVGPVETYRGYPVKLYFCPLDTCFNLIDTPVMCWNGVMDVVTVGIEGEAGSIALKCETSAYGLKRASSFRINAAQQKTLYPTDTGLDFLNGLISNPAVWLSVLFQTQK